MSYNEYYDEIIKLFKEKIQTSDNKLRNKILNCLINWYKKNYENILKMKFNEQSEVEIVNITKEIKQVCDMNDYDKLQEVYECDELTYLEKLSNEIFEMAKKVKTGEINFNQNDYDVAINKLNNIEIVFPKIIINKFNKIKSECLLDLDYLIKKGNVNLYSFRMYDYLKQYL